MKLPGLLLCIAAALAFLSCDDDQLNSNNFIPSGPVSLVINMDLPEYYFLKNRGTYIYQPGGNKGVLLIHTFDDKFVALERTCSYEPDRTCSRIFVDSTNTQLRCGNFNNETWETCCESQFSYDGQVIVPPAQFPLRTYNVSVNGSVLSISN